MLARIRDKREVADRTLLVEFDIGREVTFTPGQYFWVTLLEPPYEDERGARRHFTVVTPPSEAGVLGLCTRLRDSAFKRSLAELPVGAEVEVEEPKGTFTLPDGSDPLAFVAGGIGITPFRPMLLSLAEQGSERPVTLLYSNRDRAGAPFLDELEELERRHDWLRLVVTMTDDPAWSGESRRISAPLLQEHLGRELETSTFLLAGPPGMVEAVGVALREAGVADERIRADRFSGY